LLETFHGKEGVDDSSPSEGFKSPANRAFFVVCVESRVRTGSPEEREHADLQEVSSPALPTTALFGAIGSHRGRTQSDIDMFI